MTQDNSRDLYIDIVRGIGILCVFVGHTGVPILRRMIYFFHMPLFFLVAGMFFRPERFSSWREIVKNTFVSLVVPYFCFMIISSIIQFDVVLPRWEDNFVQEFYRAFCYGYAKGASLWFFTCMAVVRIVGYAIWRYGFESSLIKKVAVFVVSFLLGELANLVAVRTSFRYLPLMLMSVPAALVFFLLGRHAKKYLSKIFKFLEPQLYAISAVLVLVAAMYGFSRFTGVRSYNFAHSEFSVCGIIPCFLGLTFVFSLAKTISKFKWSRVVAFVGLNSLYFFPMEFSVVHLLELIGFYRMECLRSSMVMFVFVRNVIVLSMCAALFPMVRVLVTTVQRRVTLAWN